MTTATANAIENPRAPTSRGLGIALWVAQSLTAFAFLGAGSMKATQPIEVLAKGMAWVNQFPPGMIRFIGAVEVLGAIGLILPSALRIQPRLTPLAALGLIILMVGAAGTHVAIGEAAHVAAPIILGALAAFIAWGRWFAAPIAPR